jgi:uncharacterized protein (TIGR00369 family)
MPVMSEPTNPLPVGPLSVEQLREMGANMANSTPQTAALGLQFVSIERGVGVLQIPYREDLVGDPETGVIASGVITTLLDHCGGLAIRAASDNFTGCATLDLRIDYMRPAIVGKTIIGRAHCYKLTKSIGFVRAVAYEDDPEDPLATAQMAFALTGAPA